MDGLLYRMLYV